MKINPCIPVFYQAYNTWSDAFFMKQNFTIEESRFSVFSSIAVREKIWYFDIFTTFYLKDQKLC